MQPAARPWAGQAAGQPPHHQRRRRAFAAICSARAAPASVDPDSAPTGDTIFVLDEFYESPAGVVEHWRLARETWEDLPAFMDWTGKAKKVVTLHSGTVVQGLW